MFIYQSTFSLSISWNIAIKYYNVKMFGAFYCRTGNKKKALP